MKYTCPLCGWEQHPHPRYGWLPHHEKAVEVHRHHLCPGRDCPVCGTPMNLCGHRDAREEGWGGLMIRVSFIGGPFDRCRTGLLHTPPRVIMGGEVYERIDDPDTGEFLGGYAHTGQVKRCVSDE